MAKLRVIFRFELDLEKYPNINRGLPNDEIIKIFRQYWVKNSNKLLNKVYKPVEVRISEHFYKEETNIESFEEANNFLNKLKGDSNHGNDC